LDTPYLKQTGEGKKFSRAQFVAHVKLSNPNLALASALGLANPVAIAWELIPFSFVVDRFVDVGSYLNSYSETFGWEISPGCRTVRREAIDWEEELEQRPNLNAPWGNRKQCGWAVRVQRFANAPLPKYTLLSPSIKGLFLAEAANYTALLVGALDSLRK
jgi:hypothetical protein